MTETLSARLEQFIIDFTIALQEVVREVMKTQFSNSKMKITEDVLSLINEISKAIVVEAAIRAAKQAAIAGKKRVELEHVETILPQMVSRNSACSNYLHVVPVTDIRSSIGKQCV